MGMASALWPHGTLIREYHGHKKKVHSINWNCLGTKLASGSVDMSVRVWAVEELGRTAEMELKGHTGSVDQLRWDPKQSWLLGSASGDKTVRIWDTRTGKCAQAIETRGENINIRWSPNGQHISVGDKDDNISLIDMRKCMAVHQIKFPYEANEMAWDPSGELFFITTGNGTIEVRKRRGLVAPCERPLSLYLNLYRLRDC